MLKNTINFKKTLIYVVPTIIISAVMFILYRRLLNVFYYERVLTIYMALTTALLIIYLMYNRGFSRRGVTRDMLPPEWSEERKQEFIDSAQKRFKNSRWLLVVVSALFLVFVIDAIDIIIIPMINGALSK